MPQRSPYAQVSVQALLCPQVKLKLWLASGLALLYLGWGGEVRSQIAPDGSLSTNVTTPDNLNFTINDGNRAGNNLFHSFREFSVPTGGEAFFNNAADIQNIFSRVTGISISGINGLIRANGTANLFLINPNGIIFGLNAKLNIGGSFLASVASSIKFGDGIEFSAINPQTSQLLSINVPVGLEYGNNPGEIQVRGKGQAQIQTVKTDDDVFIIGAIKSFDSQLNPLEVSPGKNLLLAGGNVIIDGGILQAPGGRVEIGGLAGEGTVGLNGDGSLSFPEGVARADVSIMDKAGINVLAGGSGSIAVTGRNIYISGESLLSAGIATGIRSPESMPGDISLNATEDIAIDESLIQNSITSDAIGNSGNISINTKSLSATNGGAVDAGIFGKGNGGKVTIIARDTVSFDGEDKNQFTSGAYSRVNAKGVGNAGEVNITTKSLFFTNGGEVSATTFGQGNAGSVTIIASDTVSLDGETKDRKHSSGVFSQVYLNGVGHAGGVSITAKSLNVTNGAQVSSSTFGRGNAGSVTIIASDTLTFDGERTERLSGAFSRVYENGVGDAGGISITAKSVNVTNGAELSSSTFGQGNAGSVTIMASDTVSLDGETKDRKHGSGVFSQVKSKAVGYAGDVTITAKSLNVTNGAQVSSSTFARGNAGSVTITADTVTFDGKRKDGSPSTARSLVDAAAVGNGGGVNITARSLSITNGADVTSSNKGQGTAGNVEIVADTINLNNQASITTDTKENIQGLSSTDEEHASIKLNTSALILENGSRISTDSKGENLIGGNITINADVLVALGNSDITANSRNDRGGKITINAQSIFGALSRTREELQTLLNPDDPIDPKYLLTSDITAIGANSSLSGTVAVNTPDVDTSAGLIALPDHPIDPTKLVTSSCGNRDTEQNQFVVAGRGGLPPSPNEALNSNATWVDLRLTRASQSGKMGELPITNSPSPMSNTQIVEAQGWVVNSKGEVELVAQVPNTRPHSSRLAQQQCYAR